MIGGQTPGRHTGNPAVVGLVFPPIHHHLRLLLLLRPELRLRQQTLPLLFFLSENLSGKRIPSSSSFSARLTHSLHHHSLLEYDLFCCSLQTRGPNRPLIWQEFSLTLCSFPGCERDSRLTGTTTHFPSSSLVLPSSTRMHACLLSQHFLLSCGI